MMKKRVQRRYTDEFSFSAASEVKDENILTNIVLDDPMDPVDVTDTFNFDNALQMYYRIFHCCDIEVKIKLVLSDQPYNFRRELRRQTSDYDLFGEDGIVEIVDIGSDYLKPDGLVQISCSSVQLSS